MRLLLFLALFTSAIAGVGCDAGLAPPPPVEPGIQGIVRFLPGTWPSADSLALIQLWVFASQVVPADSATIVNGILVEPFKIYLYPSLSTSMPKGLDSVAFTFRLPVGTYPYVGVLQHYGAELTISSFKVVGLFHKPALPDSAQIVHVTSQDVVSGVNISVDFNHLPPQPF